MSKEINPDNEKQMKQEGIVEIIHGGDKQEYEVLDKHPMIKGTKEIAQDSSVKAGQKRWAHPAQVERWVMNGWVKETSTPIKKGIELPQPPDNN